MCGKSATTAATAASATPETHAAALGMTSPPEGKTLDLSQEKAPIMISPPAGQTPAGGLITGQMLDTPQLGQPPADQPPAEGLTSAVMEPFDPNNPHHKYDPYHKDLVEGLAAFQEGQTKETSETIRLKNAMKKGRVRAQGELNKLSTTGAPLDIHNEYRSETSETTREGRNKRAEDRQNKKNELSTN